MKHRWPKKTLGELCKLISGQHVDAKDYGTVPCGIGYLTGPSDFGHKNPVISKWTEHPKVIVRRGDILITVKGSGVGKINLLAHDEAAIGRQLMAVRVANADPSFVHAFLSSTFEHFQSISTGAAIPGISREQILGLEIATPPLPEQQRIVGILDEAFDGIATAKANAEKNLQNARALFESHLQAVFTQRATGWAKMKLGEISEVQSGGTPSVPKKAYWGGNIPWYSSGELNETYTIDPERQITIEGLNNSNVKLFPKGSLLIGMYDTAALKMSILDRDATFNQAIAGVKPSDEIEIEFILNAINVSKPRLLLERRGVRQKNLSLGKIKEIEMPMPRLAEQREVVSRLRNVRDETQRLESIYRQKLAALGELKKSLLHQAFTGAL
jgi:type I restriction enzyme S subunit